MSGAASPNLDKLMRRALGAPSPPRLGQVTASSRFPGPDREDARSARGERGRALLLDVEAIEAHHLVPDRDEVMDELSQMRDELNGAKKEQP